MTTTTARAVQLELPLGMFWRQHWLPEWPYATDTLGAGVQRTHREQALKRRYVEANARGLHSLLVVDIDHDDATMRALYDNHDMRPNVITQNPSNGHAHAVWTLKTPFPTTDFARRKPVYAADAITEGLRRYCDGDRAYSGLITKNPLHAHWDALYVTEHLYTFEELKTALRASESLPERGWRKRQRRVRDDFAGLGRNCWLFENVRTWAYPEVRHHLGNALSLECAIHDKAQELNLTSFAAPLPRNEVRDIANSITRWIVANFDSWQRTPEQHAEWWSAKQAARGRKEASKTRNQLETLL